jgi:protein-L-isoaspartate(D-aspartate) O-methyltransferase
MTEKHYYKNVQVVTANGRVGWEAGASYDAIIVAAASAVVPPSLLEQLKEGRRLVTLAGEEGWKSGTFSA